MNQFFIGALDLSPYIKEVNLGIRERWRVSCWGVPEAYFEGIFCNPPVKPAVFLSFLNYNTSERGNFGGFPTQVNCADFQSLEYAPYVEMNFGFHHVSFGRFFRITSRLYIALDNKGLFDE